MKSTMLFPMAILAAIAAAAEVPSAQVQIAGAVLAAPAELREGAAVLGYDAKGAMVKIREGKNEMVCLATDPAKTAFNVACYHKDLEPFMARGRELLEQKVTGAKRNEIRFKEVEEGKARHAEGAAHALRPDGHQLRQRERQGAGLLPSLGDLRAFRDAPIHRPVDQRRAMARRG